MPDVAWDFEGVVESAVRTAGLSDFGGTEHEEGLRLLVDDYRSRAGLTEVGSKRTRGALKGLLVARLLSQPHLDAHRQPIERPIVVTGLPRSGTTLLQRLLTADPHHQGLEQWLADLPQPRPPRSTWEDDPIFSAMQSGYESFHAAHPELAGLHYSDATTHEECWRLLQQAGTSCAFETLAHVPAYSEWLRTADWQPAYERHRALLRLIGSNDQEKRWVLKNPSHLMALDALLAVYPDALIVVTHRDPVTCVASMCSLAAASTRGTSHVFVGDVIGRSQLDLLSREWTAYASVRGRHPDSFLDVGYDDLVGDPLAVVAEVTRHAGGRSSDRSITAVAAELERSRSGVRAPRHRYDLTDFGLAEAQVRAAL
jgi:hypothetical protein